MHRRDVIVSALLAPAARAASAQGAAPWAPTRPVEVIVPYAAGGPTDRYARAFATRLADLWRQSVVIIVGVHLPTKLELFEVPQALDPLRLGLRPREGGQKQAGQDRDDRDDDQQLNECECISCAACILRRVAIDLDRTSVSRCFHFLFVFGFLECFHFPFVFVGRIRPVDWFNGAPN